MQRLAEEGATYGDGEAWYLYVLECSDGTFYTGVTKDMERRLQEHNDGRASKYTRSRRPVELLYSEKYPGRAEALVRECQVKTMTRRQKEKLVNPGPGATRSRARRRKADQD